MSNTPALDSQSLRRTQSTGDIPTVTLPARARISASHRRSAQRGLETAPSSPINNAELVEPIPWLRQGSQPPSGTHPAPAPAQPVQQPSRSFFQRLKDLLGMGPDASRTRKALVSLVGTLVYNILQVGFSLSQSTLLTLEDQAATVIALLSAASVIKSPQDLAIDQIHACGRPLVAWNSLWLVRLALSSGLTYWNYLRIRAADNTPREDSESTTQPGETQPTRPGDSRPRRQLDRGTSATNSEDPPVPYNHIYARLSLFLSMFTLTWFLTAHILEYTSVNTCRLSAPLVWWLTFGILCTMYLLVLEVVLFGFLVFMVLPFIMLFYSIILLCLGRHPLQNPHYIKPDIGKLPKSLVDRIPLVIYIPPPPDDTSAPISLPKPIHTYPPKPPASFPRKRFAFFRKRISKKDIVTDASAKNRNAKVPTPDTIKEPETWEDNWEQCEYPFVRLEGNRAACAICLMDFEEPKRLSATPQQDPDKDSALIAPPSPRAKEVVIPVENITEEERDALPRLEDAGEGPQPLRLLACGHVFHKTCIDPWLTDVSGRCPVCQRRVEIEEPPKKSRRRQPNPGQQLESDNGYTPSDETDRPFSHKLFDMDMGTITARRVWLKISLVAVGLLMFIILAILSIYWAALGRSSGNIHNLSGYVVDFDGGQIGREVTQAFSTLHGHEQLSWLVKDPAEFPNGPSDVQMALLDHRCWVAVTVNPGATSNLLAALNSTDAGYNTSQAISTYLTDARNEAAYRTIISPVVYVILTNITQMFNLAFARQLASYPNLPDLMNAAPSLVILPVNYVVYDLRPFDAPVYVFITSETFTTRANLISLFQNHLLAADAQSGFGRRLTLRSLILMRLLWPFTLYFFISVSKLLHDSLKICTCLQLVYCLLSLAFGVPFGRYYSAGFVIYWMMSWVAMAALHVSFQSMITVMTVKFVPVFLVLWIIVNVSVSFYPIEMLPIIFRYGYAMPFYNVSNTVRTVVFNTKNQIGLNFGVQFAWIAVSCITLPIFQWLARSRQVQAWRQSQAKEE
ncbi:hypothetical protein J3R83DRAFT_3605 [Lanmaoa asiatica]|nr:hypothetical protein J3R83DRAFT_3605 [Lanmaoa asiatica]